MGTTTEAISFRLMEKGDLETVAKLELEAFSDAWNVAMLDEELENKLSTYIIMLKEQQIIGYAGFMLVVGEADVTRVAVFKEQRGHGYGNLLTEKLVQKAWELEAEAITLDVRESNVPAIKAYEKNGFKSVGVRPNYYEKPREGAVIMWLYKQE